MIVEDYMNVYGRGWVIIARCDELAHTEINCGDRIVRSDTVFTITGVERMKYDEGWWNDRVGLILSPNKLVPDCFEVGEDIEIRLKEASEEVSKVTAELMSKSYYNIGYG